MTKHLSSEQIAEWMIGERSLEAEEHLNNCAVCRDELALVGTTLSLFRTSVRDWTDDERGPDAQTIRRVKRQPLVSAVQNACWAVATGALVVVLSMPLLQQKVSPAAPTQVDTALLLTQVNAELSESVPDAMQPLTQLVAPYHLGTNQSVINQAGTKTR